MIQQATEGRTKQEQAMDCLRTLMESAEHERKFGKLTVTVELVEGKIVLVRSSTEFTEK